MAIENVPMTRKASLSDLIMEFFEDGNGGGGGREGGESDYEENERSFGNLDEDKPFWSTLRQDLHEALSKDSSIERKIRSETKEIVSNMNSETSICSCSDKFSNEYCRKCSLRYLTEKLREMGFNSALCKSKWTRSPEMPSGEHSYVDVVVDSKSGKRKPVRIVIELNFRTEFLMARPSPQYTSLVNELPELFVGKSEKLKSVVKIVCTGAKKSMKDNNMHMGPWRKHKYMHSKWLSTPERITSDLSFGSSAVVSERKQKASLLTYDFYTFLEVV